MVRPSFYCERSVWYETLLKGIDFMALIIKQATLVNNGEMRVCDVKVEGERIAKIASNITVTDTDSIIDAEGMWLLPGMIDDQVHFREPGLTHKGRIATESAAAVAGGITSFMEMPNVSPSTTTQQALEDKMAIAAKDSVANFSFYLGATPDNIDEIKSIGTLSNLLFNFVRFSHF